MMRFWPLAAFLALALVLYVGLYRDPHEVPSPLINKAAPAFALPQLDDPARMVTREQLLGHVYLLNVWASWCVSCRQEHPLLVEFAKHNPVEIYGLDYKDTRPEAMGWLAQFGNPYRASLFDAEGRVGIDFGVYGVPETFVIDKAGVVRYKQIGPFTEEALATKLVPMLQQLNSEAAPPAKAASSPS
jgi:cytochrome c biogenesis protein CcmG, thiol:disulfide interchange protein DsbE